MMTVVINTPDQIRIMGVNHMIEAKVHRPSDNWEKREEVVVFRVAPFDATLSTDEQIELANWLSAHIAAVKAISKPDGGARIALRNSDGTWKTNSEVRQEAQAQLRRERARLEDLL